MATAGIVIIGDEILSGKFADENGPFLIGQLRSLGVHLRRIDVIADDLTEIAETVKAAACRFDFVFTSGGIGPTHDDVTIAAVAAAFGTGVERHPELLQKVQGYWGERLAPANLRLADVPAGATLCYGQDDVWPVVVMRNVYILPGVPSLFRRKFNDIKDRFRQSPVWTARLYLRGEEGSFADAMREIANQYPAVQIGSYPRFSETTFDVLITFEAATEELVAQAWQALANRLGAAVVDTQGPAACG